MAKKPNYDFERRRKEQDRKNKKEAKREERLLRKREGANASEDGDEVATPSDDAIGSDAQADGQ